jgi:HSP20 family protein
MPNDKNTTETLPQQSADQTDMTKSEHVEVHQVAGRHAEAREQTVRDQNLPMFTPIVDIAQTREAFLLQADVPGVKASDVDVSFDRGTLTIDAKVQPRLPQQARYLWREYSVGHYYRSFEIAEAIDAEGIRAELKDGVLSLYIPKAKSQQPRKVQVQTA